jgi:hypothetical protein
VGTGGPFHGGKGRPGRDADHSPQSLSSWTTLFNNESEAYAITIMSVCPLVCLCVPPLVTFEPIGRFYEIQ